MSDNTSTPITPLSSGAAWWTTGKRNSRRTALGATAIVVFLALIVYLVWMSPTDSAVKRIVSDVVKPSSSMTSLQNDRANLLDQLVSSKSEISSKQNAINTQKAALAAALGKANALESQLSAAKAEAAQAEATAAALRLQALGGSATKTIARAGTTGTAATTTTTPAKTTTGPTTVSTPSLASIINPTSRYFGLYTAQSPFSFSEFNSVATQVGEQPNISGYFQGWDQDFRADAVQASWAKGDLPMMTWESQSSTAGNNDTNQSAYSLSNIINGNFDAYLTRYAQAIAANGQPIAIRLDQEMNATWYPWSTNANGNTGTQFVQMWQHVHDIFQANGANADVVWVWAPNRIDNLPKANQTDAYLANLYPGDAYVDWIGMSGYERPNGQGVQQDGSFNATFGATLTKLRALSKKPIILAEVGAAEEGAPATATTPSLKQKWISNLFNAMADPANDDIIGFNWFNLTVTTNVNSELASNDWRITSTSASVAAFAAGIQRTDIGYALRPVTS